MILTFDFGGQLGAMAPVLQAFAYKLTKNSDDAKDLFQETAYRAITNQEKFRMGTNLKAWLFTVMRNIFINNYRKKAKANTIFDSTENQFFINSGRESIANEAESSILMDELQTLVQALDEGTRVPFMMHYYGYKYQEIAEHLALPLGTVKSRIFFARKELKAAIESRYGAAFMR